MIKCILCFAGGGIFGMCLMCIMRVGSVASRKEEENEWGK